MPLHKDLTGSDLHEPKGAAGAAANTLYVFDGSGSGSVQKITEDSLDLTSVESPNIYRLTGVIPDVSTASSILIPIPETSEFLSARVVLGAAITTADAVISFVRDDGSSFGSNVTVLQSGSAEGTGFDFSATLNQIVTGPGYIKVSTDGGSTGTVPLYVTVKLSRNL